MSVKKSQAKITIAALMLLLFTAVLVIGQSENDNSPNQGNVTREPMPQLAMAINGKNVETDSDAIRYLEMKNHYNGTRFEKIKAGQKITRKAMIGNAKTETIAVEEGMKRYAVDLVGCDFRGNFCEFRVNGVKTGAMVPDKASKEFNIDQSRKLKIKSIKFDTCGEGVRWCDRIYDSYDEVEVELG